MSEHILWSKYDFTQEEIDRKNSIYMETIVNGNNQCKECETKESDFGRVYPCTGYKSPKAKRRETLP